MVVDSEIYKDQWLKHDGAVVTIDGLKCRIKVSCFMARYPYEREVLTVDAEPISKASRKYRTTKNDLKDDWLYDVLGSLELTCEVLDQLE
jgi:hypothetical protein